MNTSPTSPSFEIVTMPIGNGWRMRMCDGQRLQFVGGFEARDALQTAAERL